MPQNIHVFEFKTNSIGLSFQVSKPSSSPQKQNSNDEKWFTVTRCLPDPILIIISAVIMGN